jgi:ethanolamine utilization protein EutN
MLIGMVEGSIVATTKHPSMEGWKLLIVQPLDENGKPDGDPQLAIDSVGAGRGMKVLITNDGKGARELVGDTTSPVRWSVAGVLDYD